MRWSILVASSLFECVWVNALSESHTLTRPLPTVIVFAGIALSVGGLAFAMQRIPASVAYSTWTGIGAALTVAVAAVRGNETLSAVKVVLLGVIVAAVVGLRFTDRHQMNEDDETQG